MTTQRESYNPPFHGPPYRSNIRTIADHMEF
jgi:hypothetical protein